MEVRLVIDTNIYMKDLDTIKALIDGNKNVKILLPRIILHELDSLKISDATARRAIKFISNNDIILEGTEERMDIVVEDDPIIKNLEKGNNDDKILKFVIDNYNSILVTRDLSLTLKAKSLNIKYILFDQNFLQLINSNTFDNQIESMEIEPEYDDVCTANIEKFIVNVADRHNLVDIKKLKSQTLIEKLEFMIRHFHYYTRSLSSNSKDEIIKIKNELCNNINTKNNISRLKIVLGVAYK